MIESAQGTQGTLLASLQNIPEDLKSYNQWVAWRAVPRADGKVGKVPVNPKSGRNASTTNPETWGTYDEAVRYYQVHKDEDIGGIGFVFTPDDPFCGVDLDDCWNPETQQIDSPWLNEILKKLNSYSEVSPSGKGVKIFLKGKLPGPGRNLGNVEMYDSGRFFTVTGQKILGYPESIKDRSFEISELYSRLTRPDQTYEDQENNIAGPETFSVQALPVPDEIKQLIADGVPAGERSEATMKVLIALIRAGIRDSVISKIFEDSPIGGKYREKGKSRATWLRAEIQRAKDFIDGKIPEGFSGQEAQQGESPEERRIITDLNQKHAVIMVGGRCLIMNEVSDPVFNRPDINFSTVTDFKHFNLNKKLLRQEGKSVKEELYSCERRRKTKPFSTVKNQPTDSGGKTRQ